MKKILLTALLATGLHTQAENNFKYDFVEFGYGYLDIYDENVDSFYFEGAFSLSDHMYLGAFYDRHNIGSLNFAPYGLSLGFHNGITTNTDFYSQLELGKFEPVLNGSKPMYGISAGTRTAFTERFELISKLGYFRIDDARESYLEVELKGLFKLTENHALSASIESFYGHQGANLGYRYSF